MIVHQMTARFVLFSPPSDYVPQDEAAFISSLGNRTPPVCLAVHLCSLFGLVFLASAWSLPGLTLPALLGFSDFGRIVTVLRAVGRFICGESFGSHPVDAVGQQISNLIPCPCAPVVHPYHEQEIGTRSFPHCLYFTVCHCHTPVSLILLCSA